MKFIAKRPEALPFGCRPTLPMQLTSMFSLNKALIGKLLSLFLKWYTVNPAVGLSKRNSGHEIYTLALDSLDSIWDFSCKISYSIISEVLYGAPLVPICRMTFFGSIFKKECSSWYMRLTSAPGKARTLTLYFLLSLLSFMLFSIESPTISVVAFGHFPTSFEDMCLIQFPKSCFSLYSGCT